MKKVILLVAALLVSTPVFAVEYQADVEGMVCDFCAQGLKKQFGKESSVESIDVNLDTHKVTIRFKPGQELTKERIAEIITGNGLTMTSIHNTECATKESLSC